MGAPVKRVVGPSRSYTIVSARHISMYIIRRDTNLTLEDIGVVVGGRDHSSVMHGIKRIKEDIKYRLDQHGDWIRQYLSPKKGYGEPISGVDMDKKELFYRLVRAAARHKCVDWEDGMMVYNGKVAIFLRTAVVSFLLDEMSYFSSEIENAVGRWDGFCRCAKIRVDSYSEGVMYKHRACVDACRQEYELIKKEYGRGEITKEEGVRI